MPIDTTPTPPTPPTRWTRDYIHQILRELTDDNPLACRALLNISRVEFTDRVETLAVTLTNPPRLLINLTFLEQNVRTEDELRAVLLHEFLHVLLLHTQTYERNTPLLNIALDATINAMIHRLYGSDYSRLFRRMYYDEGIHSLLQPDTHPDWSENMRDMHDEIMEGTISSDDLLEWLETEFPPFQITITLIGNHAAIGSGDPSQNPSKDPSGDPAFTPFDELPEPIRDALGKMLDEIRNLGELSSESATESSPGGLGPIDYLDIREKQANLAKWKASARRAITQCLQRDVRGRFTTPKTIETYIPVLSPHDRRAAIQATWNPIMPMARHLTTPNAPKETVNVYLDVSGSMSGELPHLVALLLSFRDHLRLPLWTFSVGVHPARLTRKGLQGHTTGGTEIRPVFDHIRSGNNRRNLIITDGHIEQITPSMLYGISIPDTHILLSAYGNDHELRSHGFRCTQLDPLPENTQLISSFG